MNRAHAVSLTAFAVTACLSLSAQSVTPRTPVTRIPPPPVDTTSPIEVTGCLKAWVDGTAEPVTTVAEGRAADVTRFTLTQLDKTPAQVTAAAEGAPKSAEVRLLLMPAASIDLAAHVNTTVTVKGTMVPDADTPQPVGTSGQKPNPAADNRGPANPSTPASPAGAHQYEKMSVSSVVATAKGCSMN